MRRAYFAFLGSIALAVFIIGLIDFAAAVTFAVGVAAGIILAEMKHGTND